MNKSINSGVDIYTGPYPDELFVAENALEDLNAIANNVTRTYRTPQDRFDTRTVYDQVTDVVAPEVFGPRAWSRILGFTAMQTNYAREFATVDVARATTDDIHTDRAIDRITCFRRNHAGFIFVAHTSIEEPAGQVRAQKIYEAVQTTNMPAARVLEAEQTAGEASVPVLSHSEHSLVREFVKTQSYFPEG